MASAAMAVISGPRGSMASFAKNSILLSDFDNKRNEVSIRAGVGGSEITATSPGSGGAGGNLSGVSFELLQDGHVISIAWGRGGDGGTIGNGGVAERFRVSQWLFMVSSMTW